MRAMLLDRAGYDFRIQGAASGIDIRAIGLDPQRYDFGPQLLEHCRGHLVSRTVGTIKNDFQAIEVELLREGVFQKDYVAAAGVVDTERLTNLIGHRSQ